MKTNQESLTSQCFNFHNVVSFECQTSDPGARNFFSSEYENHKVATLKDDVPRVILRFSRGYNTPKGYTFHSHKMLARWSYKITFEDQEIVLDAIGNYFSIPMIHHMLVHHSLRYLAAKNDVLLLHSSGIEKDGKTILLTGKGGAGKTTLSSLILANAEKTWHMHADDYCFIQPERSMAYLTRSHLYAGLLDWVPTINDQLSSFEKLRLFIFGKIRKWTNEGLKWPVRAKLSELWADREFALNGKPMALILLESNFASSLQYRRLFDKDKIINNLIDMQFYEARHYINLLQISKKLDTIPNFVEDWKAKELSILLKIIESVPVYSLVIPKKSSRDAKLLADELIDTVNSILLNTSERMNNATKG